MVRNNVLEAKLDTMENTGKKRLIVVLGMHRSGTSAITRGLQVVGVDLGNNLMPGMEGVNDKGFWEDLDIYALNNELLSILGSDWHHLTPIGPKDVEALHESGYFAKTVDLLYQKVEKKNVFGFKDPRVAKLLPFWKEVSTHCQLDMSCVLAVRHPLSVAKSLTKRDGFDAEKSYFLWLGYVIESLSGSTGLQRVLVDYDKLMQLPELQINRIANRLDLEVDLIELQSYKTEFLDKTLRHTIYDLDDLSLDNACPPLVREIYATLLDVASDKLHLEDPVLQNQIARWADECERLKPVLTLADRFFTRIVTANQTVTERDKQISSLNQAMAERDDQIANLSQTVNSLIIDRNSLQETLKDRNIETEGLNLELTTYRSKSSTQREQVSNLSQAVAERNDRIATLCQTVNSLIIERDSQKTRSEQLQGSLEQLREERDKLQRNLEDRKAKIESLKVELSTVYRSRSWRITLPLRKVFRITSAIIGYASPSKRHSYIQQAIHNPIGKPSEVVKIPEGRVSGMVSPVFRILLVSYYCPTRAHAGGLRILDIYALIRQQCPNIQLDLLTHHRPTIDWSLDDVYRIFDNVYLSPVENLKPDVLTAMRGSPLTYDVIDLQFHQSGYQIDAFRHIGSKIIFTPMESLAKVLFIELSTKYSMNNKRRLFNSLQPFRIAASLRSAAEEIDFTHKADEVVCVSRADAAFLRAVTSSRHIRGVDTGVSQFEFADALASGFTPVRAADRQCRILYLAYFGSETNVIALRWYLEHVHPLVKVSVPDYKFTVIGRGDLSSFFKYRDNSIELVGEVPAIAPHIKEARVGIAPALGGSGFRGKINQYAVLGLPCVVSPIAIKGLAYQDGVNIFVAETPETFAGQCVRLLTDLDLNDRMGQAARRLCIDRYSWQSKWTAIREIYKLESIQ